MSQFPPGQSHGPGPGYGPGPGGGPPKPSGGSKAPLIVLALLLVVGVGGFFVLSGDDDDDGGDGGGGGDAGGEPTPPTPPTTRSAEEAMAANISGWDACEMLGAHVHEFDEFLGTQGFDDELFSSNGDASGGIRQCRGHAMLFEDPELQSISHRSEISFGFGTANQEGDGYTPEEYQTPTGRYDQFLQVRREVYDAESLAESVEEGPWDEATMLLGDSGTGTMLSVFIVDAERDFMLELTVVLGSSSAREQYSSDLSWTLEEVVQHMREVTMVNAYQEWADRIDEVS